MIGSLACVVQKAMDRPVLLAYPVLSKKTLNHMLELRSACLMFSVVEYRTQPMN